MLVTVTFEDPTSSVVVKGPILLVPHFPPANLEKANSWESLEESDKSNEYVFPTYNVKSGVTVAPEPVSMNIFVSKSVNVLIV